MDYLDKLDKELEGRGLHFVRYADDCNVFVRSKKAADCVIASVSSWLERKLRLKVIANKTKVVWPNDSVKFGEYLAWIIWVHLKNVINGAHFRFRADTHDIYYASERRINRDVMNELATCNYISANKNIILQGYTSSEKTYLACALGKEAYQEHYRTRYIRIPDLFEEVHDKAAEVNGRNKLLKNMRDTTCSLLTCSFPLHILLQI